MLTLWSISDCVFVCMPPWVRDVKAISNFFLETVYFLDTNIKLSGLEKYLNSSLPFGQITVKFCLSGTLSRLPRFWNSLINHGPENGSYSLACLKVINLSELLVIFLVLITFMSVYLLAISRKSLSLTPKLLKSILPNSKKIILKCIEFKKKQNEKQFGLSSSGFKTS